MRTQLKRKLGGKTIKQISFLYFWQFISKQMGNVRIRLNSNATSINNFIHPDCDFTKDIIRQSYSRSQCYHLNSPININTTLDILGEHAQKLNGSHSGDLSADLLDIEFLEEIAWHIGERFLNHVDLPSDTKKTKTKLAQIIKLPEAKIRRANIRH